MARNKGAIRRCVLFQFVVPFLHLAREAFAVSHVKVRLHTARPIVQLCSHDFSVPVWSVDWDDRA